MVTLDALRKLHEHGHQLATYCPTCERWAVGLQALPASGYKVAAANARLIV
jgi:hypothetical protein